MHQQFNITYNEGGRAATEPWDYDPSSQVAQVATAIEEQFGLDAHPSDGTLRVDYLQDDQGNFNVSVSFTKNPQMLAGLSQLTANSASLLEESRSPISQPTRATHHATDSPVTPLTRKRSGTVSEQARSQLSASKKQRTSNDNPSSPSSNLPRQPDQDAANNDLVVSKHKASTLPIDLMRDVRSSTEVGASTAHMLREDERPAESHYQRVSHSPSVVAMKGQSSRKSLSTDSTLNTPASTFSSWTPINGASSGLKPSAVSPGNDIVQKSVVDQPSESSAPHAAFPLQDDNAQAMDVDETPRKSVRSQAKTLPHTPRRDVADQPSKFNAPDAASPLQDDNAQAMELDETPRKPRRSRPNTLPHTPRRGDEEGSDHIPTPDRTLSPGQRKIMKRMSQARHNEADLIEALKVDDRVFRDIVQVVIEALMSPVDVKRTKIEYEKNFSGVEVDYWRDPEKRALAAARARIKDMTSCFGELLDWVLADIAVQYYRGDYEVREGFVPKKLGFGHEGRAEHDDDDLGDGSGSVSGSGRKRRGVAKTPGYYDDKKRFPLLD